MELYVTKQPIMNQQFTNPDHHLHLQIPELRNNMIKRSITPVPETNQVLPEVWSVCLTPSIMPDWFAWRLAKLPGWMLPDCWQQGDGRNYMLIRALVCTRYGHIPDHTTNDADLYWRWLKFYELPHFNGPWHYYCMSLADINDICIGLHLEPFIQ